MRKKYYRVRICIDCGSEKKVLTSSKGIRCNSCSNRITSKARGFLDVSGQVFGKLKALKRIPCDKKDSFWLCKCDCGNDAIVSLGHLKQGDTKSCGCLGRNCNGKSNTPTYKTYSNMMRRCYNNKLPHYERYGGAGIGVCKRWRDSYLNFLEDMGERPKGTSLDRIDSRSHYEKDNCRWATASQQNRNKKNNKFLTFKGIKATLAEWAEKTGIDGDTLSWRIINGWSISDTLTLKTSPLKRDKKNKIDALSLE